MSNAIGFRICAVSAAIGLSAVNLACSFSHSSASLSDSIESIVSSPSSISSSSPESNASKYRKEVESYTQAFVVSGASDGSFMNGLGDIARKRGITDWESDDDTWLAIGRGLGRTKVDKVQLGVYQQQWAGGDAAKLKLMQKGFDEVR